MPTPYPFTACPASQSNYRPRVARGFARALKSDLSDEAGRDRGAAGARLPESIKRQSLVGVSMIYAAGLFQLISSSV
jgi:hypothetical protein